jgi:hypothetical protein
MNDRVQVREAVAVFTNAADMEAAVDDLLSSGFARADLSLLASSETVRQKLGHSFSSTRDLEDDAEVPTTAYVARESVGDAEGAVLGGLMYVGAFLGLAPIVASGGTIGAAILATVLGSGGGAAIGAILASVIGQKHADHLKEQMDAGGILLWVRTRDTEHEERARTILSRHSGQDVHIHGVPDHGAALQSHYEKPLELRSEALQVSTYHDVQILKAADGHCFARGRVFATEIDARIFIRELEREI